MFGGVQLKGGEPSVNFIHDIVDDLVLYVDKRFANFNEEPIKSFVALDYNKIPQNRSALVNHGRADLQVLLHHYEAIFPLDQHPAILDQYMDLKVILRELKHTTASKEEIYHTVLQNEKLNKINKVVELMMVVSPSTAECERGFSQMNLIKTDVRNALNQDSLKMLMTIKCHGPSLEEFKADNSISHWMGSAKGGRHVHGHASVI